MVREIIKDTSLTYQQKVIQLARFAENSISPIQTTEAQKQLIAAEVISEMYEGNAPYRPRYIVPDYQKLMDNGCEFLNLATPKTLEDAIGTLQIFYHHVPSITTMPVYIGELDTLLGPFVTQDDSKTRNQLRWFLTHLDRTITDSFCHANLSGQDNLVTRMLLSLERELQHSVPNLTMKVTQDTPDGLLEEAVLTALKVAKPSFANDVMFTADFKPNPYAIVSCYNGLSIGGGSYTLVRLNLGKLVQVGMSISDFMAQLQEAVGAMLPLMDARVDFLLEESDFFETNFLVKEGFIKKENFTAMFGLVGLADAVNQLLSNSGSENRFGHTKEADQLGIQIIEAIAAQVNGHSHPALYATKGHYVLHAQVGLDTDAGVSPGCRIPIGDEPPIHDHLISAAPFHGYFPSGIGDIFRFDETIRRNPMAAVEIIKGAFKTGLRYFSLYEDNADVVRITGYLVKKSDIEKLRRGEQVINDAVVLGKGAADNQKVLERQKRSLT